MGKAFDPPEGVGVPVFRLEDDGGAQGFHKTALSGDSELPPKITLHIGNRLNVRHQPTRFLRQKVTAKMAASSKLIAAPAEQPR